MNPMVPHSRAKAAACAAAVALAVAVFLPGATYASPKRPLHVPAAEAVAPEPEVAAAQPELPPPPPTPAMEEKFRKLQKEMESGDRPTIGSAKPAADKAPETTSVGTASVKILFGLIFVILLAVVTIRVLKRMQGRLIAKPGGSKGGDIFEVLETCHLGQHQRVVAMRINGEVSVLGVTQHGISLLSTLKQPAEEILRDRETNSADFSNSLNKLLERFKKPKKVSEMLDENPA
jgi:flagellar biogenesis protein FliO